MNISHNRILVDRLTSTRPRFMNEKDITNLTKKVRSPITRVDLQDQAHTSKDAP